MTTHLYRSMLFLPGSNARAIEKARTLACDIVAFDLEDAVAPAKKDEARQQVAQALRQDYGRRLRFVRVNAPGSPWCEDDLAACTQADAVILPKVEDVRQLNEVATHSVKPLWYMIETTSGVLAAPEIAAHPRAAGLIAGTNDLARSLQVPAAPGRMGLLYSLSRIVLAARASGRPVIDGTYTHYQDEAGLQTECEQGRLLGFDGKSLIHPSQIEIANRAFSPTPEAVEQARRLVETYEAAQQAGQGAAAFEGAMIEALHYESARALLLKAQRASSNL